MRRQGQREDRAPDEAAFVGLLGVVPAHRRPVRAAVGRAIGTGVGRTGGQDDAVGSEGGGEEQRVLAARPQRDLGRGPGVAAVGGEVEQPAGAPRGDERPVGRVVRRHGKRAQIAAQARWAPGRAAVGGAVQSLIPHEREQGPVGPVVRREGQMHHVVGREPAARRGEGVATVGRDVGLQPAEDADRPVGPVVR